jgi:hypothetical protein
MPMAASQAASDSRTSRGVRVLEEVPFEIDVGRGQILDHGEALIEVLGGLALGEQVGGEGFVGFVVACEAGEHGRFREPVLVDLGRHFDPVADDVGAGERGVSDV